MGRKQLSEQAHSLAEEAARRGKADQLTFQLAMRICQERPDAQSARAIMAVAQSFEFGEDPKLVKAFLNAVFEDEGIQSAHEELDSLVQRGLGKSGLSYAVGTMALLFSATDHLKEAVNLIEKFPEADLPAHVFNTLIAKASRASDLEGLMETTLQLMRSRNVKSDVASYNTLLNSFHLRKNYEKVEQLWDQMIQHGPEPTPASYNIMINHYLERGLLVESRLVFTEMQDRGVIPDRYTFTAMIKAFGRDNEPERAVELLRAMSGSRLGADPVAYQATIHACLSCGRASAAHDIMREMLENDIPIRSMMWTWLLEVYIAKSDELRAVEVMKKMGELCILPKRSNVLHMKREISHLGGLQSLSRTLDQWEKDTRPDE
mmetsp:Transcript_28787/g.112234  ORF Transcript_28787/g.112234 Transcript_28787/m.112234 type:complete len:376 (-) Transcript_28787:301-1428(-)